MEPQKGHSVGSVKDIVLLFVMMLCGFDCGGKRLMKALSRWWCLRTIV